MFGQEILGIALIVLTLAMKWATFNPHKDSANYGSRWISSFISAFLPIVLFAVAFHLKDAGSQKAASLCATLAYAASIGPCFWLFGEASEAEHPNASYRGYLNRLNRMADGAFKAMIVLPIGGLAAWLLDFDGVFYVTAGLAVVLLFAKAAKAQSRRVGDKDIVSIDMPLLVSALAGTALMVTWFWIVKDLLMHFAPLSVYDYMTAIAFLAGLVISAVFV